MTQPSDVSVLLVDDDTNILGSFGRLLEIHGYEHVTATSPEQGLELFRSLSPPLVISDYNFGLASSMTGVDFLAQIWRLCPSARRVLLTGFSMLREVKMAESSGVIHRVLTKGDLFDAVEVVREELERYRV